MKERLAIIIVAIVAGLFITTAGFFIYQATKKTSDTKVQKTATDISPTEIPSDSPYIKIAEPSDEFITTKRTIQIKGSTNPNNTIVISTNQEDVAAKPSSDGQFSVTIEIDAGANTIISRAIAPNGDSVNDIRTVTYSSEEF